MIPNIKMYFLNLITDRGSIKRYKRHGRWLTNRLLQSSGDCSSPLISLRLIAQVCGVQSGTYDGSRGFAATRRYCVSVRELLASEGVCFLTRSGRLLKFALLGEMELRGGPLWDNGYDARKQNKPVSFVLRSRSNLSFLSHPRIF